MRLARTSAVERRGRITSPLPENFLIARGIWLAPSRFFPAPLLPSILRKSVYRGDRPGGEAAEAAGEGDAHRWAREWDVPRASWFGFGPGRSIDPRQAAGVAGERPRRPEPGIASVADIRVVRIP